MGFCRGTTKRDLKTEDCHIAKRNTYLRKLLNNRSQPMGSILREVYTDESYMHHHHSLEHFDPFHPEINQKLEKAPNTVR